jgi:hypothetical protein
MSQSATPAPGQNKRRTERVLLRIPIEISGEDSDGKAFQEKTFTLIINRHGARVALRAHVRPGTLVTVKNLLSSLSARFRIVGPSGRSLGEGPEWGVECLQHGLDFWGISFPEIGGTSPEPELVDSLLECSRCRSQELAQLTLQQYRAANQASVRRECAKCGVPTDWRFASQEGQRGMGAPARPAAGAPAPEAEQARDRRRAKRLTVKLPVRIRLQDGSEEVTKTENLSKTGVCFASGLSMRPGDRILVTVGYSPGGSEREIGAVVRWRKELEEAGRALYGVHLEQS